MVLQLETDEVNNKPLSVKTDWKHAVPLPSEQNILSLVVGNTSISWAHHQGHNDRFAPILFWRYVHKKLVVVEAFFVTSG